jgi:hypothetical protein
MLLNWWAILDLNQWDRQENKGISAIPAAQKVPKEAPKTSLGSTR